MLEAPSIYLILISVATLVYIPSVIYNAFLHPLSGFPGPRLGSFSRLALIYNTMTGRTHRYFGELHRQYGPIVRVGPDQLSVTSPTAWKDIYTKRPDLPKDPFSQTPPLNGSDSLFTARGDTHIRLRRTFAPGFTDKALKGQADIIESHVDLLFSRLHRDIAKCADGKLDLAKYYGYTTLDIISDLTFGESYHGLEGDNEHSLVLAFFLGAKFGTVRNSLSTFYPIDRIFGYIFLRLTAAARARNWDRTNQRIEHRLEMGNLGISRSDFMSPIIDNIRDGELQGITKNELHTNGLAMVIAGCQLPAVALTVATYCLLQYPKTLKELTIEVRSRFSHEREINITSSQNLVYLSAVINEALRIHHPTPNASPRIAPPEGLQIGEQWIPGGTVVGIPLQAIHNSPLNFAEPHIYHPERFLPRTDPRYDAKFSKDNMEVFRPFATGSRACIGAKLFLAEAKVTLAKMVWNFDLKGVDDNGVDWLQQRAYLIFEPKPMLARLVETTHI